MSTSPDRRFAGSVALVGVGGVGAPAAWALVSAGVRELILVDDDRVDETNLHRQLLFRDEDVERDKLDATRDALLRLAPDARVELRRTRATPDTVRAAIDGASVVVDATDNFASRFLLADACALARVPVVHAAAVRWTATVLASSAAGAPCYRCLFEDLPEGDAPDCATAGVLGPVCGVAGALAADAALSLLAGEGRWLAAVATYDGRTDALRRVPVRARRDCPLCGEVRTIRALDASRYVPAACHA